MAGSFADVGCPLITCYDGIMDRSNPYEAAFEAYLRTGGLVPSQWTKHMGRSSLTRP